ncbi:MAG: hypothetical protein Q4D79_10745 [Propionibacteriaceae bacterium]|nr:hypothetical protein [Propionibacteriaceae bacterium]
MDYNNPTGKTIDLALKKLPASSGEPIGSLFLNPGGPGGSGVDQITHGADAFSSDLKANFDIVGFDPCGIGLSTPLSCLSPEEAEKIASSQEGAEAAQAGEARRA